MSEIQAPESAHVWPERAQEALKSPKPEDPEVYNSPTWRQTLKVPTLIVCGISLGAVMFALSLMRGADLVSQLLKGYYFFFIIVINSPIGITIFTVLYTIGAVISCGLAILVAVSARDFLESSSCTSTALCSQKSSQFLEIAGVVVAVCSTIFLFVVIQDEASNAAL
ncbi:hypothetical protein EDD86DRAFT_247603 [Gorgonomyces haynaldii]|nr:hypothetical protein EDD86DRAFT_247603 [Gorgonomyces haynaldii]